MEKLKREIEKKYDEQLNIQKEEQSNSSELKKILQEKAQQLKTMT
jgi:DNA-directed RNA polymerase